MDGLAIRHRNRTEARASSGPGDWRAGLGLLGDGVEDFQEDVVGLDPLGLGLEVQEDPVPKAGEEDAAEVLEADVEAAVEQGADLGGEHERLDPAGAAPQRMYRFVTSAANGPSGCVARDSRMA